MSEEVIEEVKIVNPLLERAKMPGESFTLPSLGIFYNDNELSSEVEGGEIYIKPMVTLDEIILKSPEKLYSGKAIEEVFKRCCPQILKPMLLLAKDVDFVLTALRKISHGNTTEIEYQHDCKNAKKRNYNLSMTSFISKTIKINPTLISTEYTGTLKSGQTIEVAPPRFLPALKIYQSALEDTDEQDIHKLEEEVLSGIASMIQKVDDITDKKMIMEWLTILSPIQIKEISNLINKMSSWGTDFKTTITCKDCEKEVDITSEINPISFFFTS